MAQQQKGQQQVPQQGNKQQGVGTDRANVGQGKQQQDAQIPARDANKKK